MLLRITLAALFATLLAHAQLPFPITKIGEIGDLGSPFDDRKDADLGIAHVYTDGEEKLRIEGRDAQGLPWRVWIPRLGRGFGFTSAFRADLDRNGWSDLVFVARYISNGRCIDSGSVTTLFFDADGRPMPWRSPTHGLTNDDQAPVTMLDVNADGRAELVTSTCEYAFREDRSMGVDRWITGIYEARDGRWVPMRPLSLDPYQRTLQARFDEFEPGYIEWKPAPDDWRDWLEGLESREKLRLTGLLTGEIGCGGVVRLTDEDGGGKACNESSWREKIRYSDGELRVGWPSVILETPGGREIHMAASSEVLEKALAGQYPLRVLGSDAEPSFLWVDARDTSASSGRITLRLTITHTTARPIVTSDKFEEVGPPTGRYFDTTKFATVVAEPGSDSSDKPGAIIDSEYASYLLGVTPGTPLPTPITPSGTYFSREGRCFELPPNSSGFERVRVLDDCTALGFLESAAAQGERVYLSPFDMSATRLSPAERTIRWVFNLSGQGERVTHHIEFQPLPNRAGDLAGAVEFPPGWLGQWSRPGESWFVLHSSTGEPLSQAIRADIDGELFRLDRSRGLVFLRWANGIPVEATTARAALEWVRE